MDAELKACSCKGLKPGEPCTKKCYAYRKPAILKWRARNAEKVKKYQADYNHKYWNKHKKKLKPIHREQCREWRKAQKIKKHEELMNKEKGGNATPQ